MARVLGSANASEKRNKRNGEPNQGNQQRHDKANLFNQRIQIILVEHILDVSPESDQSQPRQLESKPEGYNLNHAGFPHDVQRTLG